MLPGAMQLAIFLYNLLKTVHTYIVKKLYLFMVIILIY